MNLDRRTLRTVELSTDFANALQRMTNDGTTPETLADGVDALDQLWKAAGVTVSVEQMYQPDPTRHVVDFGERFEHVPCVLDALIAALAVGRTPVEIRSKQPNSDRTVHLSVTEDGVEVDPSTAVFSFGVVEDDVQSPGLSALEGADSVVMASCSYINAFRDATAYEQWTGQLSDAHAMRIDIAPFTAFANVAAEEWVVVEED